MDYPTLSNTIQTTEAWPVGPFHGPAEDHGRRFQPQQQHLQRRGEALPRAAASRVAEGNGGGVKTHHRCRKFPGFI